MSQNPPRPAIQLEVCVASVEDAIAAVAGGADRLELNSAVELGGLTPSAGLIDAVRRAAHLPLIVMCRPRSGGFFYTSHEWQVLLRDAELALRAGANGIAFGTINANRKIDIGRCREMVEVVRALSPHAKIVFHRAFDDAADPPLTLPSLAQAGIDRVMTSGGQHHAIDGLAAIANCVRLSAGSIEILPAGGITPENVSRIVQVTGCSQVHGTFRGTTVANGFPSQFGAAPAGTSQEMVRKARHALISFQPPDIKVR